MPPTFKALTTITAWTLFILGWLFVVIPGVMAVISGQLGPTGGPPPIQLYLGEGLGIASLILSACAMKLRQMLE